MNRIEEAQKARIVASRGPNRTSMRPPSSGGRDSMQTIATRGSFARLSQPRLSIAVEFN